MRAIKFRGKRKDNGQWVYGDIWQHHGNVSIVDKHADTFLIDPETVGQFTGEHEELGHKGKEIYENDVVEINTLGINYESKIIRGVVKFVDGCFEVEFSEPVYDIGLKTYRQRLYVKCFVVNRAIRIIGNIYEPELLPV